MVLYSYFMTGFSVGFLGAASAYDSDTTPLQRRGKIEDGYGEAVFAGRPD